MIKLVVVYIGSYWWQDVFRAPLVAHLQSQVGAHCVRSKETYECTFSLIDLPKELPSHLRPRDSRMMHFIQLNHQRLRWPSPAMVSFRDRSVHSHDPNASPLERNKCNIHHLLLLLIDLPCPSPWLSFSPQYYSISSPQPRDHAICSVPCQSARSTLVCPNP